MEGYYDYREAISEDIKDYIESNIDFADYDSIDDLEDELYDDLFCDDSVTGNGSGSYTFDRKEAEKYVAQNLDLLGEAIDEFGGGTDFMKGGAEACDVTIRCYLLGECLTMVLDEMKDEFEEAHENN